MLRHIKLAATCSTCYSTPYNKQLPSMLRLILISMLIYIAVAETGMTEDDYKIHYAICNRERSYGKCKGKRQMWYYNGNGCFKFTYSNCGGNQNRFATEHECFEFCTKVLHPKLDTVLERQEPPTRPRPRISFDMDTM